MADEALAQVVRGMRSRPHGNCTDLYRWLRARHDTLSVELEANRPSWVTVARDISVHGITGRFGARLTNRTVRRVWATVCRDVAAEKSAADMAWRTGSRPPAKAQRIKAPAGWLPAAFEQSNAPPLAGGEHQGSRPAALPAVPLQQQPASPPTAEAPQDSSRPEPGSIEAAIEKSNLRSGLNANGDPIY
jgi:hypothetical protein